MTPLRRYDRVWGIQIGKVNGEIKAEGVGVVEEDVDDNTASTAEMTELDLDEDGDLSGDESEEENRPVKGPRTILYGGDGTSTRALAGEEERAMESARASAEGRRGEESGVEAMPSTEVVKNRRRDQCVP